MPRAPVCIETLGRFSVLVGGRSVLVGRKIPHRPLELLKYLAAHIGQDLLEAEVAGALWPGRPAGAAAGVLSINVHRLRRLLGSPEAIVRGAGRIALDPRHAWCDAAAFEHALDQAARSPRKSERRALAARALEIYGGDFLAGDTRAAWAAPIRARLRERFGRVRESVAVESVSDL